MVNPKISDIMDLRFQKLCYMCDLWTMEICDCCDLPICDDCMDTHEEANNIDDDEDN